MADIKCSHEDHLICDDCAWHHLKRLRHRVALQAQVLAARREAERVERVGTIRVPPPRPRESPPPPPFREPTAPFKPGPLPRGDPGALTPASFGSITEA